MSKPATFATRAIDLITNKGEIPMDDLLEELSCSKNAVNGVLKQIREAGIVLEDDVFYFRGDSTSTQTTTDSDTSAAGGDNADQNTNATATTTEASTQMEEAGATTTAPTAPTETTTAAPAPAAPARTGNAPRADSQMSKAKAIYHEMYEADNQVRRKDIIARLKTDLGMTDAGASTYVQTIRTWRKGQGLGV